VDIAFYIIFFVCVICCGWSSYKIGHKDGVRSGAESTIDMLHENRVISFDNKGNIIPNPYFKV
jgi:hypothetical protein